MSDPIIETETRIECGTTTLGEIVAQYFIDRGQLPKGAVFKAVTGKLAANDLNEFGFIFSHQAEGKRKKSKTSAQDLLADHP